MGGMWNATTTAISTAVVLLLVLVVFGPGGITGAAGADSSSSPNWAGLVVKDPSQADLHGAVGTWIVPSVSCSQGETSASATWVGIGGDFLVQKRVESLYQDGTNSNCADGHPTYYAWQQQFGEGNILQQANLTTKRYTAKPLQKSVAPGDVITASVVDRGLDTHWSLIDSRSGRQLWRSTGFWYTHYQHKHTAECIVEDNGVPAKTTTFAPLSDFGQVEFEHCKAIDQSGNERSIEGQSLPNHWTTTQYAIKQNGEVLATTSINPLVITFQPRPVLGAVWDPNAEGWGQIKPTGISLGGAEATGFVQSISWQSWGGARASGTGTSIWVPADAPDVAAGRSENVTVVASDLGTCGAGPAYKSLTWFFPEEGQSFSSSPGFDACTGQGQTESATPTIAASTPCDPSTFISLMNTATDPGDTNTVEKFACSGTWAVASGTTTFPPGGSPSESFVVLFQFANGAWSILSGPDDGTCIAAEATSAPCSDGPGGQLVSIPPSVLSQLVQQAGLALSPDGTIS